MKSLVILLVTVFSSLVQAGGGSGTGDGPGWPPRPNSGFEIPGIDGVQLPNWQIPQFGSLGSPKIDFKMQPVIRFDGFDSSGRIVFSRLQTNRLGVVEVDKSIANSEGDLPEMWVEALIQSSNEPGSWWIVGDEYQSARPYR